MDLFLFPRDDYAFLDSGKEARLERFGSYILNRPAPQAVWPPERPEVWRRADAMFTRGEGNDGQWTGPRPLPPVWTIRMGPFSFELKATAFGHVGLFPEHAVHGEWLADQIRRVGSGCRVLHLFAYTGALTLAAAAAGASVCHVDAVEDIVRWARRNAERSGLSDRPIRWIVDDAVRFVAREGRRRRHYDGVILDPPTYGKGPGGERWRLEEGIVPLLDQIRALMADRPRFLLFTCHTPGFSPPVLENLMRPWRQTFGGYLESGHMRLAHPDLACSLPAGVFVRWSQDSWEPEQL